MIVVDTNVIGYLYLSSDRSRQVEVALQKAPRWAAPLLWRSELRNVLAFYVRQHGLSLVDALRIMEEAERLMQGREFTLPSVQVLNLVAHSTCSAYDCEFVALAMDLNVPLVTSDRKLLTRFHQAAISPDDFLAKH